MKPTFVIEADYDDEVYEGKQKRIEVYVYAEFQASLRRDAEDEFGVDVKIVDVDDGSVEEIYFGGSISIYPRHQDIYEYDLDFSKLRDKIGYDDLYEVKEKVIEYLKSEDAWYS